MTLPISLRVQNQIQHEKAAVQKEQKKVIPVLGAPSPISASSSMEITSKNLPAAALVTPTPSTTTTTKLDTSSLTSSITQVLQSVVVVNPGTAAPLLMPRIAATNSTSTTTLHSSTDKNKQNRTTFQSNNTNKTSPILSCGAFPEPYIGETNIADREKSIDDNDVNTNKRLRGPGSGTRLNKFVRRLHDMLQSEKDSGIVEWRRGLLVLHSTDTFAKTILPRYFNTRNFKTFRRQLNYYGFVHVRSFSTTGSTTTALWVNRDLAKRGTGSISSVLLLKRVEPCETAKTAEGRRARKEQAVSTVEDDIGVSAKSLQLEQIRSMALRNHDGQHPPMTSQPQTTTTGEYLTAMPPIPMIVHCHHPASTSPLTPPLPPANIHALPTSTVWSSESHSESESSFGSNTDEAWNGGGSPTDAANLLLMLSRAAS